jgi:hypothetical protein
MANDATAEARTSFSMVTLMKRNERAVSSPPWLIPAPPGTIARAAILPWHEKTGGLKPRSVVGET